jgi:spore germination protein GerM
VRKKLLAAGFILLALVALYAAYRYGAARRGSEMSFPGEGVQTSKTLPQTRQVDLYFADVADRRLSIERREVTGEDLGDLLLKVLEELVKGPQDAARVRTLPETTQVKTVFIRDETVWVDLDSAVRDEHPGGAWTEVLAVYSVVNTLVENFSNISQVQILIEGNESETLAGHVDISRPLASRVQLLAGDWE